MRRFKLIRTEDPSGVSGLGHVAEGTEFHDRQIAVSWFGRHHIMEVADNIDIWIAVHGHDGKTKVVWIDPNEQLDTQANSYKD